MKKKYGNLDSRTITLMGLLIAIEVVLSRFLAFESSFVRISLSFIPLMLMGYLFGPWLAGTGGVIADIIGMMIFPKAAYFFGFTINAFLIPMIYGLFFYQESISLKRNLMAQVSIMMLVSLFLTPLWLNMMLDIPIIELMPIRLLKEVIVVPINVLISHVVFNKTALMRAVSVPQKSL